MTQMIQSGVVLSHVPARATGTRTWGTFLGRIVQRVSSVRFRDYVTAEILRPLGMTATVWQAGDVPPERRAIGCHTFDGRLVREPLPSNDAFDAAGGMWTSLRDYALRRLPAGPRIRRATRARVGPLAPGTVREIIQNLVEPLAGRESPSPAATTMAACGWTPPPTASAG